MPVTTCVFDAYGTLFDVTAAARQAASEPDFPALSDRWQDVAALWRQKQLQYTWLRAVAGAHTDFWEVTQNGLDWALEATGLAGQDALRQRLLDLYFEQLNTTTATLYDLGDDAYLMDSPGVRDYAPDNLDAIKLANGYREFKPYLNSCHFSNCTHNHEPKCSVRSASETNDISPHRYQRYLDALNNL